MATNFNEAGEAVKSLLAASARQDLTEANSFEEVFFRPHPLNHYLSRRLRQKNLRTY